MSVGGLLHSSERQKRRVEAKRRSPRRRDAVDGYVMIAPWLIGFIALVAGPMIASLLISFTDWQLIVAPKWVGLQNYITLLTSDPLIWKSLGNTAFFALIGTPLYAFIGLILAVALNRRTRGMHFFRVVYFIPSLAPVVASTLLWILVFQPDFGYVNAVLQFLHIPKQPWLMDPSQAKPVLIVMYLWGVGGSIPIFLGGLQSIPTSLYEVAALDGASGWQTFRRVTLPLMSPVLLFVMVTGFIQGFQAFTTAYVATGGGPSNSTLFYVLYLYQNAFNYLKMGYASSMAWLLFVIIMGFTAAQFFVSRRFVYYETTGD